MIRIRVVCFTLVSLLVCQKLALVPNSMKVPGLNPGVNRDFSVPCTCMGLLWVVWFLQRLGVLDSVSFITRTLFSVLLCGWLYFLDPLSSAFFWTPLLQMFLVYHLLLVPWGIYFRACLVMFVTGFLRVSSIQLNYLLWMCQSVRSWFVVLHRFLSLSLLQICPDEVSVHEHVQPDCIFLFSLFLIHTAHPLHCEVENADFGVVLERVPACGLKSNLGHLGLKMRKCNSIHAQQSKLHKCGIFHYISCI